MAHIAVLAHRGASAVAPENSLEAFCEARRLGADGVELDVRRSEDGALVVHHDPEIAGIGPISALRVTDLPPEVPLLEPALAACGELLIVIELKDLPGEPGYDGGHLLATLIADFVAERALTGRVVVSSFDLGAIGLVHSLEPAITTAWLTPGGYDQQAALESVISGGHAAIHPHHTAVTPELVAEAHRAGIAVTTWTVDEPERIRDLAEAGVDGIITNRPDVARAALG
ncbi:MAG TPA: glycerophosphodiester phosphodiesterase [Acidimicrobiales bacterium]